MAKSKKFLTIAKFEFKNVVRKPTFWLATLFLPVLMGVISFVSGYASIEATKKMENLDGQFTQILVLDEYGIFSKEIFVEPLKEVKDYIQALDEVKDDTNKAFVYIPSSFGDDLKYDFIYQKDESILSGVTMVPVINSIIKQSIYSRIEDPLVVSLLAKEPSGEVKSFDKEGEIAVEGFGQYILPIASLVVFFLAVFISSTFLLESVSAEKENRMIETMLSIVDKKSLMFGKLIGLVGIVSLQLLVWLSFGILVYVLGQQYFSLDLPIDISNIDYSVLPVNIFFTISGFIFFASIMVGVGAIGTGAQDSRNLSSVFILLAIFPIYLMQILVMEPSGTLAKIFTYFPFTSHMILLVRNSLGALSIGELILGVFVTTLYGVIALWLALKMFELGCLMYNRRPSFREILGYLSPKKY
ncbi:hypothetical protein CVU76_01665 [Candidatus Dojkabacteria bacterium HGW-Dojkabacteria-1]|uniref:ABC-2 type transporter transmembrane domain-containing protein n=1 Tax=Candidatus Dojkabacteria bacterium HGW-Dojkabacteria-1 TaxID=2013761 RepID=A0A2N2F3J2_9BACT|nr:MAG: hypothetical protein CVU76_01665 [Candidatus Dojkabacteria bacterium HGW-Dojkabacteria-1]